MKDKLSKNNIKENYGVNVSKLIKETAEISLHKFLFTVLRKGLSQCIKSGY